MSSYIYVMKCEDYMKIGMSTNIKNRLESISACTPFDVSILGTFEFEDRASASVAERLCHEELKKANFHKKLEWFHLNDESMEVVKKCTETIKGGQFKRIQRELLDLKKTIKLSKIIKMSDACEYLDGLGFNAESRILRRSHEGPYCTIYFDQVAVKKLSDFVKRSIGESA